MDAKYASKNLNFAQIGLKSQLSKIHLRMGRFPFKSILWLSKLTSMVVSETSEDAVTWLCLPQTLNRKLITSSFPIISGGSKRITFVPAFKKTTPSSRHLPNISFTGCGPAFLIAYCDCRKTLQMQAMQSEPSNDALWRLRFLTEAYRVLEFFVRCQPWGTPMPRGNVATWRPRMRLHKHRGTVSSAF